MREEFQFYTNLSENYKSHPEKNRISHFIELVYIAYLLYNGSVHSSSYKIYKQAHI